MPESEFTNALNHASYEGLNKLLEIGETEDKCVFAVGAMWARDYIAIEAIEKKEGCPPKESSPGFGFAREAVLDYEELKQLMVIP